MRRAEEDLRSIYDFVAHDKPSVAARLVFDLVRSTNRLQDYPVSGRVIPKFSSLGIREIIVPPYRIAYRQGGEEVRILKVHHGARLLHRSDVRDS